MQRFPFIQMSGDHQGAASAECEADHNGPGGFGRNTVSKMDLRSQPDGLDLLLPWPLALWSSTLALSLTVYSSCCVVYILPAGILFSSYFDIPPWEIANLSLQARDWRNFLWVPWLIVSFWFRIWKSTYSHHWLGQRGINMRGKFLSSVSCQAVNRSVSLPEKTGLLE